MYVNPYRWKKGRTCSASAFNSFLARRVSYTLSWLSIRLLSARSLLRRLNATSTHAEAGGTSR